MDDYTVRTLSEDGEVLNAEDVLQTSEYDAYLEAAYYVQLRAADDILKRSPEFGPLAVQMFHTDSGRVIWEERISA